MNHDMIKHLNLNLLISEFLISISYVRRTRNTFLCESSGKFILLFELIMLSNSFSVNMSKHENDLDALTSQLLNSHVAEQGLSFQGKSLKLDTADLALQVSEEIDKCENLVYLDLDGNTIGIDAAKKIGESLRKHAEFKKALWKNMFTGRTKDEIPPALTYLGSGIIEAGANLVELDLSDNAFGPVGVEGIANLIHSSSFHSLQVLRLNNNGLGITGGKLLAKSLQKCYDSSGQKFALRVFQAGRNRLENAGAEALARVFKMLGTLVEVTMPQNGIYDVGILALSEAFKYNPHLRTINLSDNTPRKRGAMALATALPALQNLETLNLSDCLLKTEGATVIARALAAGHPKMKVLLLESNEIDISGGMEIIKAVANKRNLTTLNLNGNKFGSGIPNLISELKKREKFTTLESLSEDEGSDEDSDDSNAESDTNEDIQSSADDSRTEELVITPENSSIQKITVAEFLAVPSIGNFMNLGENKFEVLSKYLNTSEEEEFIKNSLKILLAVSNLCECNEESARKLATSCSAQLYQFLFNWAARNDKISLVTNAILVQLRFIKAEEKSSLIDCNQCVCVRAFQAAMQSGIIPKLSCDMFNLFLEKRRAYEHDRGDVTALS